MDIPKPKYKINQTVYAFTKDGLMPFKIERVIIYINKEKTYVRYGFDSWGDCYEENQIIPDYKKAKKRLEDNSTQLIMLLD